MSQMLKDDFGFLHVSAGALLREEVEKETTIGEEIKKFIDKGELVPNQFVVEMIKLEVEEKDDFILDGFPRSLEQAKAVEGLQIDMVIFLDVPEDVVVSRFSGRRVCEKGHTYHLKTNPPKQKGICNYDGLPLTVRKDDNPDVIRDRFKVYHKKTQPLLDYYEKEGILVKVNGAPLPKVVYKEVKRVVEERE